MDKRVAKLRRLAASTEFEGERDAALRKAEELESKAIPKGWMPPVTFTTGSQRPFRVTKVVEHQGIIYFEAEFY